MNSIICSLKPIGDCLYYLCGQRNNNTENSRPITKTKFALDKILQNYGLNDPTTK